MTPTERLRLALATLATLRALVRAYLDEPDPARRAALERQVRAVVGDITEAP